MRSAVKMGFIRAYPFRSHGHRPASWWTQDKTGAHLDHAYGSYFLLHSFRVFDTGRRSRHNCFSEANFVVW